MEKKFFFDIVVRKEKLSTGKPVFVARCTTLGIASQGNDVDEAMKNIKEAVELCLEEMPEKLEEIGSLDELPTISFIEVKSSNQKIAVVH